MSLCVCEYVICLSWTLNWTRQHASFCFSSVAECRTITTIRRLSSVATSTAVYPSTMWRRLTGILHRTSKWWWSLVLDGRGVARAVLSSRSSAAGKPAFIISHLSHLLGESIYDQIPPNPKTIDTKGFLTDYGIICHVK